MKKKPVIAALFVLALILAGRAKFKLAKIDRMGPMITYSNQAITYTEGKPDSELLSDVQAIDKRDGDVSDTLIVEKVTTDPGEKKAVITYAAIDHKNNLSKVSRMADYVPRPKADEKQAQEATPSGSPDPSATKGPEKSEDGSSMVLGTSPIMILKSDRLTVYQNDKFTIRDFISRVIDDHDSEKAILGNVKKDGSYDTAVKGEYEFKIYVVDSEGNQSNKEKVTLVVQ